MPHSNLMLDRTSRVMIEDDVKTTLCDGRRIWVNKANKIKIGTRGSRSVQQLGVFRSNCLDWPMEESIHKTARAGTAESGLAQSPLALAPSFLLPFCAYYYFAASTSALGQ
eukprot:scaffold12062_cov98-Skeletonema_dohrnii-CCMP3373.AAC.4